MLLDNDQDSFQNYRNSIQHPRLSVHKSTRQFWLIFVWKKIYLRNLKTNLHLKNFNKEPTGPGDRVPKKHSLVQDWSEKEHFSELIKSITPCKNMSFLSPFSLFVFLFMSHSPFQRYILVLKYTMFMYLLQLSLVKNIKWCRVQNYLKIDCKKICRTNHKAPINNSI